MLREKVSGHKAHQVFEKRAAHQPHLGRFHDSGTLIDWLVDYGKNTVAEEDAVIRELRLLCRSRQSEASTWQAILFLGLWPAMEWAFHHVRGYVKEDRAAISVIWGAFVEALDRDEVWTDSGIVKRLMYRLRKRAKEELLDKHEREKLSSVTAHMDAGESKRNGKMILNERFREAMPAFASRSVKEAPPTPDEIASLRELLITKLQLSIFDTDLLIRHFVMGESLTDIASSLDISSVACRQRCSRLVKQLRNQPALVRRHLVTLSNLAGMECWEDKPPNDEEGDDVCPIPWMN